MGYNRPIWINLLGPNNDELERISNLVLEKFAKIKGITCITAAERSGTLQRRRPPAASTPSRASIHRL